MQDPDRWALEALKEVALADERVRIERVLSVAREHLGMQISYFSRFTSERQVILGVEGDSTPFGFDRGTEVPIEDTFCKRMLDETIPPVVADAHQVPKLRDLPTNVEGNLTAYVGVPLQLSSGRIYGTLCCANASARPELGERDVAFMRVLARLLAESIENPPPMAGLDGVERPTVLTGDDERQASLSLWLVAAPKAVHASRRALDCLADWIPDDLLNDVRLATTELVSNGVRHAGLSPANAVAMDVDVNEARLRVAVTDPGDGFDTEILHAPEEGQIGGWGLHIVSQITDRWGVETPSAGGNRVWFECDLRT